MDRRERTTLFLRVTRGLQAVIAAIGVAGLALRNASVVVNAALGLGVTVLPGVLRRDYRLALSPGLSLWIALAVLLHSIGMMGVYVRVGWWDHLTHALSGSLVAGVGYSTAVALDEHSDAVSFPRRFLFVYVLVFTLAFGVLWEVLEFASRGIATVAGWGPVLVQYGLEDTMLDLMFDAVGALAFAAIGTREWRPTADSLAALLDRRSRGPGDDGTGGGK